jgi:hypothetical protein
VVIISENLVIAEGGTLDGNSPLIGYANQVTTSSVAATTANASYPVSNLANPATHLQWKGTATSATEYITITPSGAVDYLAIARHNFGTAAITVVAQTTVDSGATWVDQATILPGTDEPILFWFASDTYDTVRLKLTVGATLPALAVLYAGALLRLQRHVYVGHTPITMGRDVKSANGMSEAGHFLGRVVVGEGRSTSLPMENLTPSWYRTYMDPFVIAAQERPFFFAWRPGDYPLEIGYCWLTNSPRPTNQRSNGMMQVEFQMAGIA